MRPIRHVLRSTICVATLAVACSGTGNEERAYFTKQGERYLVEMKGRRRAMAHDPVSAVRGRTYEETLTIELPRIEGVIDGAQIPVSPDKLRYVGRVVITKDKMSVDLYYDDSTRHPLPWNGEYTLVQKDAGGRTQVPRLTPTSPASEQRNQAVTVEDLRILERAEALLKDESAWNRADDRECKDDEATGKRSLFCALQKACIDVLGTYDHRRVALQEVRFAVEDATRGQDFEHRLRDFNNLATTRLADIKAVLRVAMERVRSRLKTGR